MKFTELGLCPELLTAISSLGFEAPTPVQAKVIPALLEGDQDVAALAQTGTGKTAAFGLPILQRVDLGRAVPQALILCPTRELCMQITRDLQSYAVNMPSAKALAVYGGADIQPQLAALRRGVHIVVATPGRMLDVLRRKRVDFSKISTVVLDEADEMLNMGFEEDLEGILSTVPDNARTLLFSATMPVEVEEIARKYMESPAQFTLGTRNSGAENVSHEYYVVHAKDRYRSLRRVVDVYPRMYGIVFCRTRVETQQVADRLGVDGYNAAPLHGDLSQLQRDSVMKKFRDRHVQILVATDVAARGLDVNDLSHVINYNMPDELNAYTHRSGRTGRAGKEGISASIINPRDQAKVKRLERVIGKPFRRRNVPTGDEISRVRVVNLAERVRDYDAENGLLDSHMEALSALLEELPKTELIKRFVSINLHRMLHFYKAAPDLNVAAGKGTKPRRADRQERGRGRDRLGSRQTSKTKNMAGLVMNVGSTNGLTPPGLLNLVNVANRDSRFDIGRINIVNKQAYFEVPRAMVQKVIDSFDDGNVSLDGRKVTVASVGTGFKENPRKKRRGQGGSRKRR